MSASRWTAQSIPDQSGRVAIVTGASSGIGIPTAGRLAERNARVILAVRDAAKGEQAAAHIRKTAPSADLRIELLDLANLKSVRAFADRVLASERRLDLLINNAGVMFPPPDRTQDGFEPQFGTNHLGHFALTGLLAPLLHTTRRRAWWRCRASRTSPRAWTSTISTGSAASPPMWPIRTARSPTCCSCWSSTGGWRATAHRPSRCRLTRGWAQSKLNRNTPLIGLMHGLLAQSEDKGALPTLRAACDPAAKADDYYGPGGFKEMRGWPRLVESSPGGEEPGGRRAALDRLRRIDGRALLTCHDPPAPLRVRR